jgi:D-arabinose 1-dehydrogenase-like Zn-dependent alcohol dehydrogenase
MKASRFTGAHKRFTRVELDKSSPSAGQVLIEVKATSICHSDVGTPELNAAHRHAKSGKGLGPSRIETI